LLVVKPLTMKTQNPQTFILLPEETFERIIKILEKIEKSFAEIEGKTQPILGEYIPQTVAMEKLDRKETWFYERRKNGKLPGTKVGRSYYYRIEDLDDYIKEKGLKNNKN
jgi:hypothetical protein